MRESLSWFRLKSQRVGEKATLVATARGPGDLVRVIAIRTRTKAGTDATIDGKKGIGVVPGARRKPTPEIENLSSTSLTLSSLYSYQ
jgi:hypothetical protein